MDSNAGRTPERPAPWVRPAPWARIVFIAVILLQIVIPGSAALLNLREPHQWSWSMFSGYQVSYQFYLETVDGNIGVDPQEAGWWYGRIGYTDVVPRRLCAAHPEATAILRQRQDEGNYYNPSGNTVIVRLPCGI